MPPEVRELDASLLTAGFQDRGGRGSHRNFSHPRVRQIVILSGAPGDDAKRYQVRAVKQALEESLE